MKMKTDVLILGGGHAGAEAAAASARLGCDTLLITMSLDTIAQMSCNPAIGGLAKGQLVREIDAFGGLMGRAIDATGIQFRTLNASKGPAVRSPRAQADKWAYQHWVKYALEQTANLRLLQDRVTEIVTEGHAVVGVRTAIGLEIVCQAVVVCTGTFPRGKTHIGASQAPGGRFGEPPAVEISESLKTLGLPLFRLKTGTCPRINAKTIDTSVMTEQPGEDPPRPFSFQTESLAVEQIPCHSVYTNTKTHAVVQTVLQDAPLFSGQIEGIGPRYCPSFELKLVRFPDKERHLIYVEPEGRHTEEVYLNGLSTSLDCETQLAMVRSIEGMADAEITRFGYAVEYDAVHPRALTDTLACKDVAGLYLAGQINGTSGYEEAAAQGLIAGANAALFVQQRDPLRLRRDQAYIGVLIDDLVTRGTEEPYRLFTSRAEHRLLLRADNADLRLTPIASEVGLVPPDRADEVEALRQRVAESMTRLRTAHEKGRSLLQHSKNPECSWEQILALESAWAERKDEAPLFAALAPRAIEQVCIEAQYDGYFQRQRSQIKTVERAGSMRIPLDFDYFALEGLRIEAREKLSEIRPETIAQAGRISGVSPADLTVLTMRVAKLADAK